MQSRRSFALVTAIVLLASCRTGSPGPTAKTSTKRSSALLAYDLSTGKQVWAAKAPSRSVVVGGIDSSGVIISGTDDCKSPNLTVAAVDPSSGVVRWTKAIPQQSPCTKVVPDSGGARLVNGIVVAGGATKAFGVTGADARALSSAPPLTGIDTTSGDKKWSAPPDVTGLVAATAGAIIATLSTGQVTRLSTDSGLMTWTVRPKLSGVKSWALGEDLVLVGGTTASIEVIDPAAGRTRWTKKLPKASNYGVPAVSSSIVLTLAGAATGGRASLLAYSPTDGSVRWKFLGKPDTTAETTAARGIVLTLWRPAKGRGHLEARNPDSGKVLWTMKDIPGVLQSADSDGSTVVLLTNQGATVLDARTGALRWKVFGGFGHPSFDATHVFLPVPEDPANLPAK